MALPAGSRCDSSGRRVANSWLNYDTGHSTAQSVRWRAQALQQALQQARRHSRLRSAPAEVTSWEVEEMACWVGETARPAEMHMSRESHLAGCRIAHTQMLESSPAVREEEVMASWVVAEMAQPANRNIGEVKVEQNASAEPKILYGHASVEYGA